MGNLIININMAVNYSQEDLKRKVQHKTGIRNGTLIIQKKSLDARKKGNLQWQIRICVESDQIADREFISAAALQIPCLKGKRDVCVMGMGPAGLFAALVLSQAGCRVKLVERGKPVEERAADIKKLDETGILNPESHYVFGEGGAGTFSDGKLTSRSKHISREREWILKTMVESGAPEEILYVNNPHTGSDKLLAMMKNLRKRLIGKGVEIFFETRAEGLSVRSGTVQSLETNRGSMEGEAFLLASGHSAYDTFQWLMKAGVLFRTKNFALGMRAEHPQLLINNAQWGQPSLEGIKAAEYRLTSQGEGKHPVYSFCMCPGGKIVPASVYNDHTIVNGMSFYARNSQWANAAVVAALNLDEYLEREIKPEEALEWLYALERDFHISADFKAPAQLIGDFLASRESRVLPETSYPRGLESRPLHEMFPPPLTRALQAGLKDFSRQIKGYETGLLAGLESKTSCPIQALRDEQQRAVGFSNLYLAGEGSGWAGGIISSAADGVRAAFSILREMGASI